MKPFKRSIFIQDCAKGLETNVEILQKNASISKLGLSDVILQAACNGVNSALIPTKKIHANGTFFRLSFVRLYK